MSDKTTKKKRWSRLPASERRLLRYISPFWKLFVLGLICTLLIKAVDITFAFLIGDVVNAATVRNKELLNLVCAAVVGIHVLKWAFTYAQTYTITSATQRIAVRIRNELYSHLQALSLSFFERHKVGHLMSRMTNDVGLIQNSAHQIIDLVSAPVGMIAYAVAAFMINWKLALISLVVLPFMSYTVVRIGKGMRKLTELLQVSLSDIAAVVQETLSAVRVVKSFGMEDYETSRFANENSRSYRAAMKAVRRSAAMSPSLELIGVTGIAFVLWLGGRMVAAPDNQGFDIGALVKFLMLLRGVSDSARVLGRMNVTYHQTMAGAQRIFDVLDEEPEIADKADAVVLPEMRGRVEFQDVRFSYSKNVTVLEHVSFTLEPGQQLALVGPSGSGKSTIANLIPRFYEVSSGAVLIDEHDVRSVTLGSLRQHIGIVPQESILFSTTIKENIAYGRMSASDEEIIEAARAANAHDFIEKLPDGYNTVVGERGTRLSGGERQRVAIARALLKNPKLLILDEATSSLDVSSEAVVQEALERLMKDRTTLVIAHRLSTIVNADKILVMQNGRIVESGNHKELLAVGGLYSELYSVQSKGGAPRLGVTGGSS